MQRNGVSVTELHPLVCRNKEDKISISLCEVLKKILSTDALAEKGNSASRNASINAGMIEEELKS